MAVHANTGLVCLSLTSTCPAQPPTFEGAVGSTVKLNVLVQGSDAFNNFNVWVRSNFNYLNPMSVDLTQSILPDPSVTTECFGVRRVYGNCSYANTSAVEVGANGSVTPSPATGLLFSINFNVTNRVPSGSTVLLFFYCQFATFPPIQNCVLFSNGGSGLSETTQDAYFNLVGDVNYDCRVDILDLVAVALSFQKTPGQAGYNPYADLDGDGVINILDLVFVAIYFGQKC